MDKALEKRLFEPDAESEQTLVDTCLPCGITGYGVRERTSGWAGGPLGCPRLARPLATRCISCIATTRLVPSSDQAARLSVPGERVTADHLMLTKGPLLLTSCVKGERQGSGY